MTLSLMLIFIVPLILIPIFFLPRNKLTFYTICASIGSGPALVLSLLDLFIPTIEIGQDIGRFFFPMWSFIIDRSTFKENEMFHLSFFFTMLFFYFLLYIISFLFLKRLFIGTNPDIIKVSTIFEKIVSILLFFIFTYGTLFMFFVEIRQVLPLRDGFLGWLFQLIYRIEA